jgi:hypothetical protein
MSGLLLLLLGALGTGLPTHSHGIDEGDLDELVAPDHHDHGVVLTDQSERIPTLADAFAVGATAAALATLPIVGSIQVRPLHRDPPHERAPPSNSSRAPPLPV